MDYINLLLIDKGYYDYDFQEAKPIVKVKNYDESAKSDDEIKNILSRFGWGKPKDVDPSAPGETQDMTNNDKAIDS